MAEELSELELEFQKPLIDVKATQELIEDQRQREDLIEARDLLTREQKRNIASGRFFKASGEDLEIVNPFNTDRERQLEAKVRELERQSNVGLFEPDITRENVLQIRADVRKQLETAVLPREIQRLKSRLFQIDSSPEEIFAERRQLTEAEFEEQQKLSEAETVLSDPQPEEQQFDVLDLEDFTRFKREPSIFEKFKGFFRSEPKPCWSRHQAERKAHR